MQRVNFIIILLFFLMASCAKQKPKGILSEKDMVALMTEISLTDAYLNTLAIDSGRKVMPVLYEHAYGKFQLDSAGFVKNLDYYLGNPGLTEKVYAEVGKSLTVKDKEYQRVDSIRNVFVQDSLQQVMLLQRNTEMLRNMILNVHVDSTAYKYTSYGADFLAKAELNVNAYGIQVPVITPVVPNQPVELKDRVNAEPVEKLIDTLADKPKLDTAHLKRTLRKTTN